MASMLDDGRGGKEQHSKTFLFARPQFPYDAIKKPWSVALRKKKLFFYYKEELMPRYTFIRKHSEWKGPDVTMKSIRDIMEWIERQPLKLFKIE